MIPHPKGGQYRADDPGEPTTGVPRVSIADDEVDILALLVEGARVLEIGTGLGVSARAMARTAAEVVTVDVDPWVHENIWPLLPRNVRGVTSTAGLEPQSFDAVFIDGDHGRHAVRRDVEFAETVVRPGGLLIAHDAKVVGAFLGDGWSMHDTTYGLATRCM